MYPARKREHPRKQIPKLTDKRGFWIKTKHASPSPMEILSSDGSRVMPKNAHALPKPTGDFETGDQSAPSYV